jgi:hypothetical protein
LDTWEEKYNDLLYYYRKRGDKIEELENKNNKLYADLNHAEFRIENELIPRIKREERSYDNWVTGGGSDECFQNGMGGNCGIECSIFGNKNECFTDITKNVLDRIVGYGHCVKNMDVLEVKYSCKKDGWLWTLLVKIKNWIQNKKCIKCWGRNLKFNKLMKQNTKFKKGKI